MVISEPSAASRAGTLTLVGGELAFDFANTSSGRGWPTRQEHLRNAADIADWSAHARVLPADEASWLRETALGNEKLARGLIDAALGLREDIYVIGSEIAAGRPAPRERVDSLTRTHALCLSHAHLAPFGGRFAWSWATRTTPSRRCSGRSRSRR